MSPDTAGSLAAGVLIVPDLPLGREPPQALPVASPVEGIRGVVRPGSGRSRPLIHMRRRRE
jgi:hypothetical protein